MKPKEMAVMVALVLVGVIGAGYVMAEFKGDSAFLAKAQGGYA